ncbi:hypothetical protein D0Y50_01955 [Salinimonas sediminis]|uniref:DUF3570 domain-containing protein n=2 Tax=Salinimonas sediminis TaxID=2303538 RepID=A0A346NI85_9ALTE|nr:hypothetical protein D0Y50_01955 [Salinimonas sediminis]
MACISLVFCTLLVMPNTAAPLPSGASADAVNVSAMPAYVDEQSDGSWMDEWQHNLTQSMNYTAQQLDSYFAMKGSSRFEDARAQGRLSLGWEPRTRDISEVDLRFNIRVKLPALKDRVDLLLSDDEDYDESASIKAARQPIERRRDNTTIALRYRSSEDAKVSYRIGTGRRGQIYVKSRFADMAAYSSQLALFYDAEAYYYTRDRAGAEVGATVQYITQRDHVFRFNHRFYYRDRSEDWIWRHEGQYLQPLNQHAAMIYTLFTEGGSQPDYRLNEVYISSKWRSNPTREWLFFEVEPFLIFLRDEDFKPSYGVAMRVEVYYGSNS